MEGAKAVSSSSIASVVISTLPLQGLDRPADRRDTAAIPQRGSSRSSAVDEIAWCARWKAPGPNGTIPAAVTACTPRFQMAISRSPLRSAPSPRRRRWRRPAAPADRRPDPGLRSAPRPRRNRSSQASGGQIAVGRDLHGRHREAERRASAGGEQDHGRPGRGQSGEETASLPGASSRLRPRRRTSLAVAKHVLDRLRPPFCTAPSDFSSRVVIPPATFPGEGFSETGSRGSGNSA